MLKGKSVYFLLSHLDSFEVPMACWSYIQLWLRSEYEKLETKYLKAKETNEQLLKELQLLKESKGGFEIEI